MKENTELMRVGDVIFGPRIRLIWVKEKVYTIERRFFYFWWKTIFSYTVTDGKPEVIPLKKTT